MSCVGRLLTTALKLSELVPLRLSLSVVSVLRLSWELGGLAPPESKDGLNSYFPFFWVNAVGFLWVHGGV